MNILVDNLLQNAANLIIPGFFVRSTAPINVEQDAQENKVDQTKPTIHTVIDQLYRNSAKGNRDAGLVITIHGYNTGSENEFDGVLQGWYQPLCDYVNNDPFISRKQDSLVLIGYRWPSESLKQKNIRRDALLALPVMLRTMFWAGLAATIVLIGIEFWTRSVIAALLMIPGVLCFSVIISLILLRISVYFRDTYRATYFGVPDLVELIRQLDQGLIQRKLDELWSTEQICDRLLNHVFKDQVVDRSALLETVNLIQAGLADRPDLTNDAGSPRMARFVQELQTQIPLQITDATLQRVIIRIMAMQQMAYNKAQDYWRNRPIKLSFIGHSMGGHVTTQVIRILSDVFDARSIGSLDQQQTNKAPSSRIGRVFTLGRLVLVSPDIPLLTITSGRSNFLRSSLRRFEEAYLFSNDGDLALRVASTAANYFSFPAKTRTQGYRLGNLTVHPKYITTDRRAPVPQIYGIVNLDDLASPTHHLLPYLEVSVLTKNQSQQLDPSSQDREEAVASLEEDQECLADLFTYFDCTEYSDFTDYPTQTPERRESKVMILNKQSSPLSFFDYVRLLFGYATFNPSQFPNKGRDVHGGYFWGRFSKMVMYRLAFIGFQGLLDSIVLMTPDDDRLCTRQPLPPELKADLETIPALNQQLGLTDPMQRIDPTVLPPDQLAILQTKREIGLRYLSWLCDQKKIQVAVSPERYHADIQGRDRDETREMMLLRR